MNSCCLMSFLLLSCCFEFSSVAGSGVFLTLGGAEEDPGLWAKKVRPPGGPPLFLTRHVVCPTSRKVISGIGKCIL